MADFAYNAGMATPTNLGEFEQLILLAILRLGDDAYAVTIRDELIQRAKRDVARGALYTALDRMESKGLITSRMGDPTPQRGGRAKRYVTVTAAGMKALTRAVRAYDRLLDGLDFVRGAYA
jgi:DNA-binding PadR family transcriptional regulator